MNVLLDVWRSERKWSETLYQHKTRLILEFLQFQWHHVPIIPGAKPHRCPFEPWLEGQPCWLRGLQRGEAHPGETVEKLASRFSRFTKTLAGLSILSIQIFALLHLVSFKLTNICVPKIGQRNVKRCQTRLDQHRSNGPRPTAGPWQISAGTDGKLICRYVWKKSSGPKSYFSWKVWTTLVNCSGFNKSADELFGEFQRRKSGS